MIYLASACKHRLPPTLHPGGDSLQGLSVSACHTIESPSTYDANETRGACLPLGPLLPASSTSVLHSPVLEVAELPLGSGVDTLVPRNIRHNLARSVLDFPSQRCVLQMLGLFNDGSNLSSAMPQGSTYRTHRKVLGHLVQLHTALHESLRIKRVRQRQSLVVPLHLLHGVATRSRQRGPKLGGCSLPRLLQLAAFQDPGRCRCSQLPSRACSVDARRLDYPAQAPEHWLCPCPCLAWALPALTQTQMPSPIRLPRKICELAASWRL